MAEYIDRDALFDNIKFKYWDVFPTGSEVISIMMKYPAANVRENVTGYNTGEERYFKCSECGYGVADVYEASGPVRLFEAGKAWNFCPNCGADMTGGNDG